ncbi:Holliday junction resolvase RuvX [uncultured Paludibaculum sp.]|uniref:Holliday junction resolvase RuvX n=1 Tax=uncultured Paludibaculum sp. TaxID=1765020 RepID=UPI002AABF46F|nr:Holliday junction resolvase RuvX [uncultured Paludibaculum sp.]
MAIREGRILALDVGRKRIGLAVSDSMGLAQGLDTLQRKTMREDIVRLRQIATERKASLFLVGLPLNMRGDEGEMAEFVRTFAVKLEADTGIPVRLQDERLTSVEAESRLQERGLSLERMLKEKRKGVVDRLAAMILLEDYLRTEDGWE